MYSEKRKDWKIQITIRRNQLWKSMMVHFSRQLTWSLLLSVCELKTIIPLRNISPSQSDRQKMVV